MVAGKGSSRRSALQGFYTWLAAALLGTIPPTLGQVLNPPYFNLAEGRKIVASSTCGQGVYEPELYCKLVGANTDREDNPNINLIQGQVCDFCDPHDPKQAHPAENAIDGSEKWWQSPPLSRGSKYNEVNLTIDLGQEFHVAYVFIKMGNSPRPGVWILERSTDEGITYEPWQYFADTPGDCLRYFGKDSLKFLITQDDTVICETRFSKVVPLEGGEIVVSLLNDRPNADNFSYSAILQEWTKATNIRLRFLRTKTLLGHLMSVARQDPTVTRRYFYSIKDINIGGRCVCNGHAETCDLTDPGNAYKLLCRCQHNTCGPQCHECCPGFQQKKWRRAIIDNPFVCEPCNCFDHSDECIFDEDIENKRLSLDIHSHYEGGGVCKNCRHNTQGINCNQCKPTFYRPYGKLLNATDVCQSCNCDLSYSTGNCADGNGQCECREEFLPPYCNACNIGYYGYPGCRPCDCHPNGTLESVCEVGGGQCPCKTHYRGKNCNSCAEGFYGFPECLPCDCNPETSINNICAHDNGQCICDHKFGGRQCYKCRAGHYNYPLCQDCACDPTGCTEDICNSTSGSCLCKPGYGGHRCDRCAPGYYGYPNCRECECNENGAVSSVCDNSGRCRCLNNYAGPKCDQCSPGYYNFPDCLSCDCNRDGGSIGISCDHDGICTCHGNFDGVKCDACKEGFYNFPLCEECNCNPMGVLATFLGCGSLTSGELCECKERVTGRICNECKPLFWNLKAGNPFGCEECGCFGAGTVGGLGTCDKLSGKCMCKPNVDSRECSQCRDGSYNLDNDDLFGCKDCGCDIGGSVNNICDKQSGQCSCRPRINGRKCDEPLLTHYFPTLFQHLFEIEDGRTPVGTHVRFGYEESIFPGFSWRGYAVFSDIQKEVLLDIYVDKPSLYQVLFRYLNFGGENIYGTITFTPETFVDIQQSSDMVFETTMQPKYMTVSGKQGLTASPFVLNPGRWTVSIRVEKPLFLDYMILLPQSYYEATLLQEVVNTPCGLNGNTYEMCQNFQYPALPINSEVVRGEAGYVADGDNRTPTQLYAEEDVLQEIQSGKMAWLDREQHTLHTDFRMKHTGPYIVLVAYHTPDGGKSTTATVEVTTANEMQKGKAIFYDCTYSFHCRQVVIDQNGEVAVFELNSNFASVILETDEDSSIAIDNVALVPADFWDTDYIVPQPVCVRQDGKCVESTYFPIPESTKMEFESGSNEERIATTIPSEIIDANVGLVFLHSEDSVVDLHGAVPAAGLYTFLVHYYQPDHPEFQAQVIIQNGQFYEAVLPLAFCPSASGCRAIVQAKDNATAFQILENYVVSIKLPDHTSVYLDYLLTLPPDQFHDTYLHPLPQDKAGKFITECGQDSFYISSEIEGFCRESSFSLTSEYNNGALPCQCDTDGSLSYECEQFGGQCLCKPNVIGRTCSQCKTGFFGFPNCKVCDCPLAAVCHPVTGQCICPPRVTGDRCDTCIANTFGFDSIIGCEKCDCSPLGVIPGNLQCHLQTGQCTCKSNVVGRTCDKCKPGHYAFPYCQLCNCDLRGSTEDICEQDTARCYCKENVYGDSCDQCKPGTFHLEELNPLGCTKCFCFGTTDRCSSAILFVTQVLDMESWDELGGDFLKLDNDFAIVDVNVTLVNAGNVIQAILPPDFPSGLLFYFSAPQSYLGNKLSSYGGTLSYTILTILKRDVDVGSFVGPNLVLVGNNITIVHDQVEQPAGDIPFEVKVNLVEREFQHLSGRDVTREQMMMVLVNLEYILIRGSYFHPSQEIRLENVLLDVASDYIVDAPRAMRVEQCQCPPGYVGLSCEKCAPGHYRAKTGPYLGYCVPCQCHGHASTCDINTGKCQNCQHNTVGNYCEMCGPGYHGDATRGSPYDCLICACPLPIESNNFGESCEVSPSGSEISCMCKPGYLGARCSACAAGFFGQPELLGSSCQPCQCSGNIDPSIPGSCDSVSGTCVLCLNNTFGAACELCAPGFFGDAVEGRCNRCDCDTCGAERCDNENGGCVCWPNVDGRNCDTCSPNHWGFQSCRGCRHCNCGPASRSEQCDIESGQCVCQSGAGGLTCDVCEPGFWKYSEKGCLSCNCAEKYSAGAVCDAVSGQCQCLTGVIGDKCDSCPFRWVFVKNQGCYECGPCVHSLLDETDRLHEMIKPVTIEMQDISTSYFANKRLQNVNKSVDSLKLAVDAMSSDSSGVDFSDFVFEVQQLEKNKDSLDKRASKSVSHSNKVANDADETRANALDVEKLIHKTISNVKDIVHELGKLSEGLLLSTGPNIDYLIEEANHFLDNIRNKDFQPFANSSLDQLAATEELLQNAKNFKSPVLENKEVLEKQIERLMELSSLFEELKQNSQKAYSVANDAHLSLQTSSRQIPVKKLLKDMNELASVVSDTLDNAMDLLEKAKQFTEMSQASYEKLGKDVDQLQIAVRNLKDHSTDLSESLEEIHPLHEEAKEHAKMLMDQATILENMFADTRESADAAVQAANAYKNIVDAIDNALSAGESAVNASEQAGDKSDGVAERAEASKHRSADLLNEASLLQNNVAVLEPLLNKAKDGVLFVAQQNVKTSIGLDVIAKDLDKLPLHSLSALAGDAANGSALADNTAKTAQEKIHDIVDKLPDDKDRAELTLESVDDTKQAIKAAHNYIERISSIIPDTSNLMDKASKKESALKIIGTDVGDKILKLQQKLALARNQADRIKLSVQFFENTTLQVRNPEGIQRAATYTQLSMFFKTVERHALLAFVGNEKGSHAFQTKRIRTDDYLALEIRSGIIVLTMDLGSGAQEIKHQSYVSDGIWHQVIVERIGKICTITVRTEGESDVVVEDHIPGRQSVFNLDQQISKFFIGGIPDTDKPKIPNIIKNHRFDGCIEEVEFGKIPVGLWNFVHAENNFVGCEERDALVVQEPSNGLRFSGSGYVILPRKKLNFATETYIKMKFKTYSPEGLLFLIGKKNDDFLALELREGKILLKYELGSGMAEIKSLESYNDGKWHSLEATRAEAESILKVDNVEVGSGKAPGTQKTLSTTNQMFVGGYPGVHSYDAVTNQGFEGCIMDMQISADIIDLNKNKEALGVVNGCPTTVAREVSFTNESTGYVAMPTENLENFAQITLKFRTSEDNGQLFYAANEDQSKYLSIALIGGILIMRSEPGGEIKTNPDLKYNDKEWHYVSALRTPNLMRLDIDDVDSVEADISKESEKIQVTTPLYFGGVSDIHGSKQTAIPLYAFIGCLGDTTVNNKFQNFAESQDREVASLASCSLADMGKELAEDIYPTSAPSGTDFTTLPDEEHETEDDVESPEPVHVGKCALPLHPLREKAKSDEGTRFGNTAQSRQEFVKPDSFMNTILDASSFSLEFRSTVDSGMMFYVAGRKHVDFLGLFMQEGKVVYVFNCGTGSAFISTQNTYNDGQWHHVTFSRQGPEGILVVDDEEVRGTSLGTASSVNVRSPFYIGGLSDEVARQAKNNFKGIVTSFPGCMKNIVAQGVVLTSKKPNASYNATGCFDKVEDGTFFSADGGHVILYDKYKVGIRRQIKMDIKPRSLSGVLMSIHGNRDYLLLQMVDGKISFSVDNGHGVITTTYTPADENFLCNGNWHTIAVAKVNNVVTLSVDGESAEPGIGFSSVSSTDTDDPLYIGGVPDPSTTKGVETLEQFTGCIRYLLIDGLAKNLTKSRVIGNVRLNTCSTV